MRSGHVLASVRTPAYSLRFRLLAVALITAVPLTALMWWGTERTRDQERADAQADLRRSSALIAGYEGRLVNDTRVLLTALADDPSLLGSHCNQRLARALTQSDLVANLGVLIPDGRIVCSGRPSPERIDLSSSRMVAGVQASNGFAIGSYEISDITNEPVFEAGLPLRASAVKGAILFASIRGRWLLDAINESTLPRNQQFGMFAPDGTIIARHPDAEGLTGTVARDGVTRTGASVPSGAVATVTGLDHVRRTWVFRRLDSETNPTAYLVIGIKTSSLFADSDRNVREALIGVVIATFLGLAVAWALGTQLVLRPVRAMLDMTSRLAAGDLRARVSPKGWHELDRLGRALDDMAARLADREERLQSAERRFRTAFAAAPIGMALLGTGEGERVREINHAVVELTGYELEDLRERQDLSLLFHSDDRPAIMEMWQRLARGETESAEAEHRLITADDRVVWVRVVASLVRDSAGTPAYVIMQLDDITARRNTQVRLEHLALHDPLTGLPNRTSVLDRITRAAARSRRAGLQFALLFLDIDQFKQVNDTLGHDAGDVLLATVASRIHSVIRPGDTAGRLAGDEFVIVCEDLAGDPELARTEALIVAERLSQRLSEPLPLANTFYSPSASIGVTIPADHMASAESMLREADLAMYRAKELGGGHVAAYDDEDRANDQERVDLTVTVKDTLDRVQVRYERIVDLTTRSTVGFVAHALWDHPDRGTLPGERLTEIVGHSGAMVPLSERVLGLVCADVAARRSTGGAQPVTVELPVTQLGRPDLVHAIERAVQTHGLTPELIRLEIAEHEVAGLGRSGRDRLHHLREAGFAIGLDSFGTGPASLAMLRGLPLSFVALDAGIVSGIAGRPEDQAMVRALVAAANALGIEVFAEGVSTEAEADLLARFGCQVGTGQLFGEALTSVELVGIGGPRTGPVAG